MVALRPFGCRVGPSSAIASDRTAITPATTGGQRRIADRE
jgi:hypothetical protein